MISVEIKERLKKLLKANKEECESREEAESERLKAKQRDERVRLAVEEEVRRSAVLTEWERTWLPPQSEEMLQTFHEMWAELLEELVYNLLDQPTTENVLSLDHWNLVVCEDVPVENDPRKQLELNPTGHSFLSSSEDSSTKDSPAPPSDDESFHSATEELDEPVGPPPTATDESAPPTVPHRMDQQERVSDDGKAEVTTPPQTTTSPRDTLSVSSDRTTEVTTPPQTTPHPHDTLSAIPELALSTLDRELKTLTKPIQFAIKLGIPQYRIEIIQQDHRHDTEGQKIALFQYIAKNHKSVGITWSSIADALRDIHAGDLSLRIREQYCSRRDVYFQVE